MPAEPWWQTLYELRYTRGWREPEGLTARQVEFIIGALALGRGDQALDVACGYGRHALGLLQRGYHVTGLDFSQRLIEAAREAADRSGLAGARFVWGNMLQTGLGALRSDERFDAAFLMDISFGFFSDMENQTVLQNLAGVLKPEGRLLLDLFNPWTIKLQTGRHWLSLGRGGYVLQDRQLDPTTGVIHFSWTHIDPNAGLEEPFPAQRIRVYTYPEVSEMLTRAGFKLIGHYGCTDAWPAPPYTEESDRMVLVAQRAKA